MGGRGQWSCKQPLFESQGQGSWESHLELPHGIYHPRPPPGAFLQSEQVRMLAPASRARGQLITLSHSSPTVSWAKQADSCFTLPNPQFGQSLGGNRETREEKPSASFKNSPNSRLWSTCPVYLPESLVFPPMLLPALNLSVHLAHFHHTRSLLLLPRPQMSSSSGSRLGELSQEGSHVPHLPWPPFL